MVVESSISDQVFEVGDMVWAKMRSQPWWPGQVYSEEFATPMVRRSKREGLLLVALFGASSFGWFDPSELIPFDSNYAEKSVQTNAKAFVKAVEVAVVEVNRRIGLGLSCMCANKKNFKEIDVQGLVVADVAGCDSAAIGKTRVSFQPKLINDFLRQLALEPASSEHVDDIEFIKNKATVLSYRKAVFENSHHPARKESSNKAPLTRMGVKNTAKLHDHAVKHDNNLKRRDERDIKKEKEKVASSIMPVSFKDSTSDSGKSALKDATHIDQAKVKSAVAEKRTVQEVEGKKVISHTKELGLENKKKQKEDEISLAEMFFTKKRSQYGGPQRSDGINETDISRVLSDLHALAVDPCNTINKGSHIKGKKACLRFRSLVFRKSKNFSLPLANGELNANKTSEVPPLKPPSELKPGPPDRQEEPTVAKKQDVKQAVATASKKPGPEPEPKPTMLILKFPQGGSLPSFNEPSVEVQKDNRQSAVAVRPPSILKTSSGEEAAGKGVLHDPHSLAVDHLNKVNGRSDIKGTKAKAQNVSLPLAVGETNASKSFKDGVEPPPVKPPSGPKRGAPDRQEEMPAVKRKKVGDVINSNKEKKITKMIDQPPARDVKQPDVSTLKKPGPGPGPGPGPTMLTLKFPRNGSLPSYNELKARFTRYGPLDHSATHIFYNTFSCQVLYRHRAHAQAAQRFVVESSSVFGNKGVKCTLKEVEIPTDRQPPDVDRPVKSILKKSSGEEAAGSGGKGRVKFVAGGDASQMMNKISVASFSSHVTTDLSNKKLEKGVNPSGVIGSSTAPPPQPPPSLPPVTSHSEQMAPLPLVAPNIDIEKQMVSLLTRCSDVVTNVSNILGYMPYHPL